MKQLVFSNLTISLSLALFAGCAGTDGAESGRSDAASTEFGSVQSALTGTAPRIIDIIVHPSVVSALTPELNVLKADMTAEGWAPRVSTFTGTAAQLRTQLATELTQSAGKLVGAFLIGDLPGAKVDSSWPDDGFGPGLTDYYYMDLDGEWRDTDGDGGFDFHGPGAGDRTPEIFVGRLVGSNVTFYGKTEVELLKGYLQRDHAFRTGASPSNGQSIFYNHQGFETHPGVPAVLQEQTRLFPKTTVVPYDHDAGYALSYGLASRYSVTTPTQILRAPLGWMFETDLAAGVDYMHILTHGTPTDMTGMGASSDFARIAMAGGKLPKFINANSCSTARIADQNSIGATAILGGTLGYFGFGTLEFYDPPWNVTLLQALQVTNATTGEALRTVQQSAFAADPTGTSVAWLPSTFFLLGDPTLRPSYKVVTPPAPQFVNTQKLEAWVLDAGSNSQSTALRVFIKNVGTAPVTLTGKHLRYVFNMGELPGSVPVLDEYNSPSSTVSLLSLADGLHSQRWAVDFDFSASAGTLAPGASTSWGSGGGENVRLHFSDWRQTWAEGDDYSATGKSTTWTASNYLNIYDGSTLIYGLK